MDAILLSAKLMFLYISAYDISEMGLSRFKSLGRYGMNFAEYPGGFSESSGDM